MIIWYQIFAFHSYGFSKYKILKAIYFIKLTLLGYIDGTNIQIDKI